MCPCLVTLKVNYMFQCLLFENRCIFFSMKRASSGLSNCDLTAVLVSTAVDLLYQIYFLCVLFCFNCFSIWFISLFLLWDVLYIRHISFALALWNLSKCVLLCMHLQYRAHRFWRNLKSGPGYGCKKLNSKTPICKKRFVFWAVSCALGFKVCNECSHDPQNFFLTKNQHD